MTYLEMILTFIIISIVIGLSYPKYDDDRLEIAADEIIAQMKYISYLATIEDNFDIEDKDYKGKLWQIHFHTGLDKEEVVAYTIFKDKNANKKPDKGEFLFDRFVGKAVSPYAVRAKRDRLKGVGNKSTYLNRMYGVDGIEFPTNCKIGKSQKLIFDKYGQVYIAYIETSFKKGDSFTHIGRSSLTPPQCPVYKLILTQGKQKRAICIETRTSYIHKCSI